MLRALHLENFRIVANHALRIERELVPCPVRILEEDVCISYAYGGRVCLVCILAVSKKKNIARPLRHNNQK